MFHLRDAKSFLSRAACKVPHCQKWDCHALPLFALDRAIPRLFSISILIAGETKNGRAKSTRWSVWQPCFWGCDMTLRTPPAASKVHQNNETTKAKKDDTNIHVLNWGGPPLGVQNLYTFPTPKTGIKQIEQFNMSPGLRKKAQDAQDAVLKFFKFSVSIALTRRLRFLRFLRFSVYYAIYKMNRGFEIFEVFSFNRTDKVFEIFLSNGASGYYNTIRRGPKQVATKGPAIIPPKALRILVRICSQVPAKVQSALLVACVRSLEGRREGESKKQTTHQKTKTKLSSATPNRDKTIHCQRKRNVAAESAPHPRHAAKACDNNTQTIPNNIVLWQRWATCRRGWRH